MSGVYDRIQHVPKDVRVVAVVESPLRFSKLSIHVFLACLVEHAHDWTIERGPDVLDAVNVHVPDYHLPLHFVVIDRLMACIVVWSLMPRNNLSYA